MRVDIPLLDILSLTERGKHIIIISTKTNRKMNILLTEHKIPKYDY